MKSGEGGALTTTVDQAMEWARSNSLWPLTFGLACCAIEMMAIQASNLDISRFGSEIFRNSPRQSDLMIVSGTVTKKMAPRLRRIYDEMPYPKYEKKNYNVILNSNEFAYFSPGNLAGFIRLQV